MYIQVLGVVLAGFVSMALGYYQSNPNVPANFDKSNCNWYGHASLCGYYCLDYNDFKTQSENYKYDAYYCSGTILAAGAVADTYFDSSNNVKNSFGKPCTQHCKILCCT
jgi:hypothetical protein